MSRGAAQCGVSQSAASQHVQEVERRFGSSLFDRSKRPLELTDAGKIYAEFCKDVLRREAELEFALQALKGGVTGTVRVASIYSVGISEMSRIQQEFSTLHPEAQLEVDYMRPDRIYESVRNSEAELGVVSYPEASRDIAVIPWRAEQMQLALPPTHPLAGRDEVLPQDLSGENYIAFDEELPIRRELDRFFRTQGVEVHVVMHFDNTQMVKEAVALGSGISILPARTMQAEITQGRLATVPLRAPELCRPVGIIHLKRKKLTRAAEAFLELLAA